MTGLATVWGVAGGRNDVAVKYHRNGTISSAHSAREIELELPGEITVRAGHGGPEIGVLTHAELDKQGTLHCVAVVDGRLADWDEPLFWSGDWLLHGTGLQQRCFIAETAQLEGLAAVEHPAFLGSRTRPLKLMRGDYRESRDRDKWPWSWIYDAPHVKRALEERSSKSPCTHIAGPPAKFVEGGAIVDGQFVPAFERNYDQRRIEHGPAGRVLSVR